MKYFLLYVAGAMLFAGSLAVYFFMSALSSPQDVYTTLPTAPAASTSTPVVVEDVWRRDTTALRVPSAPMVSDSLAEPLSDDLYKLTADDNVYAMYYDTVTGSLTIMLYQTPLTFARVFAEQKLRELFPDNDAGLCAMDIVVMTNGYVDARYAGYNLGLSFCPGSVVLE